jgi:predicted glycosyltransferase
MSILKKIGINENDKYFLLRFVAFKGHHDGGHYGLNVEQKRKVIQLLLHYGKVYITSERLIEPEFEQYRIPVPAEVIHSLIYYSSMFIGDSQTMISEAAIMGVPALKCNTFAGQLSVPNELEEKYGLCFAYHPSNFDLFYNHIIRILENNTTIGDWYEKKMKFFDDKIDVTAFYIWFIEHYPESIEIMKQNPDYQYNFR